MRGHRSYSFSWHFPTPRYYTRYVEHQHPYIHRAALKHTTLTSHDRQTLAPHRPPHTWARQHDRARKACPQDKTAFAMLSTNGASAQVPGGFRGNNVSQKQMQPSDGVPCFRGARMMSPIPGPNRTPTQVCSCIQLPPCKRNRCLAYMISLRSLLAACLRTHRRHRRTQPPPPPSIPRPYSSRSRTPRPSTGTLTTIEGMVSGGPLKPPRTPPTTS